MKIAINECYGEFCISEKFFDWLLEKNCPEAIAYKSTWDAIKDNKRYKGTINLEIARDNPLFIEGIETLGDLADGRFSKLKIVEIPDDVEWVIEEYDGMGSRKA